MATAVLLAPSTPPDYHRITSPTLRISDDHKVPIPVGILACQRDPLLRYLTTSVVATSLSQPVAPPTKKPAKKSVIAPTIPSDPLLEVILHDTVIFPEGGGQPTDTGLITTTANSTVWEVVQAKRHGGHAVHYVRVKDGDVDAALLALSPGASVVVSLDQGGWDRRYDHMSMHTSQHLLSALLETRLDLPTLSWSLTSYPSPCYVEIPRGMSPEEIISIQTEANRLVFEGRKVHIEVEELDRSKENGVPTLETGRSVGKALPDDYTGGVKRVVVIDGVDRNPCCGTHLPSIHNLQLFLLPHTEALSRSNTMSARLYFLAGPRLIAHLTSTHNLLTNTANILSCGAPLVPDRVNQVVDERKRAEKRLDDVETDLARFIAGDLINELSRIEGGDGVYKKHVHRTDDSGNVLGFLNAISFALSNQLSSVTKPYVVVLTSSPSMQTNTSTTVVLLVGSDDKLVKAGGEGLKSKLGVKGGGKGTKWSGKFIGVWREAKESTAIEDVLSGL
ncbi:putative alanyl-tRNA editing protein alaX [Hypsizygus marmoreus]|uniref:Alanyl-tRNA editing protein alaX n=1 Tax=Hypsizygus marmoreus TaxID=39966 RepID=A0A369JQ98_HYPMA|nr:putative alanyl-tRNA editing protein alaX [Hypsizygus marmoreus]